MEVKHAGCMADKRSQLGNLKKIVMWEVFLYLMATFMVDRL